MRFSINPADNELAGNLPVDFIKNSGSLTLFSYELLPFVAFVFALAPDVQIDRYIDENLQQATRITLECFN